MVQANPTPQNLPVNLTPFIGRQADLDVMLDLYQDPSIRWVTILGAGGVGKTRLALQLVSLLQDQFQHGIIFISLAQLSKVDELLPSLAVALGVQLPPGGVLRQAVLDYLRDRQVLLVLDNFEHLLEEAFLIHDILAAGSQVKVLVTSREKLNLEAETLYHLQGLEVPPPNTLHKVKEFDAVRLFLQKANQARPGFSLNVEDIPAVVQICQLVEGLPLGILLAAAWVEYFSPAEIYEQVSGNLDFLTCNLRDVPVRHSCMRAVFDSSYNRLGEQQKAVFRKLAVFRGGFNLVAAKVVAGADLRTLIALVDKSLLWRDPFSGRYDLHELLRQYAGEELAAIGEQESNRASHARYYIEFIRQREPLVISHSQTIALDEIQADFENIREAWRWVIENRDAPAARDMLPGLYAFCDMRSRFYEGEALFRIASEGLAPKAGDAPPPVWALALLSWYDMRTYIERFETYEEIISNAQNCLDRAMSTQDPEETAASLVLLGAIAEDQGDFEAAIHDYELGMQSYPLLDNVYWVNMRIGLCYQDIHEYAKAIQAFQLSLQRGKEMGERVKTGWSLLNIGDTLFLQGNMVEAQGYVERAFVLFQEIGTTLGLLCSNYSLSRVALELGNLSRAREHADVAGRIARQIHAISWIEKTDQLLQRIIPEFLRSPVKTKYLENETFSQRELEVLQLLKSELNGPEIASLLVVSLNTIRYHTKNIYRKLQANNRLEAIRRAKELGL